MNLITNKMCKYYMQIKFGSQNPKEIASVDYSKMKIKKKKKMKINKAKVKTFSL